VGLVYPVSFLKLDYVCVRQRLKHLGSKPVAGSSLNSALECNRSSKINMLVEGGGFWSTFILQMMCSFGLFLLIHSHASII